MAWLNDDEAAAAQERMKGFELAIAAALNPAAGELLGRLGLEAGDVEPWEPDGKAEKAKQPAGEVTTQPPLKKTGFFDGLQFDKETLQRMARVQQKAVERARTGRKEKEEQRLKMLLQGLEMA